jgi:hypothetical protein
MKYNDLENILKDELGDWDLTQITFEFPSNIRLYTYIVKKDEEMRIDLVCKSIYGKLDHIDIICNLNNIDNQLNIKAGERLLYPNEFDINTLKFTEQENNKIINEVTNTDKSNRIDKNRKKYLLNNQSLPPTLLDKPIEQVDIDNGNFTIGGGLF